MTDVSLKQTASQCLSTTPDMTVLQDVFDYDFGAPERLSLQRQLGLVRGQSFGVNIIAVCPSNFSTADRRTLEAAIQQARDLFAQRDIGLRGIERYHVTAQDANGHCNLGDDGASNAEARALTQDFTVPNDYLDLFVVNNINPKAGWSAVNGPCDKQHFCCAMSGSVVEMLSGATVLGNIIAHELGHYFGLNHTNATNNFMNDTVGPANTNISSGQAQTIKGKDCFTEDVC